jgi:hypothetical protein
VPEGQLQKTLIWNLKPNLVEMVHGENLMLFQLRIQVVEILMLLPVLFDT